MNKIIVNIALVGVTLLMLSCYKDNEEYLYGTVTCDTTSVSFAGDILPIINNNCGTVGCHIQGGSASPIYENYANVKASVDNGTFENRVLILRNMPPSSPLTDCQISHIQKWVNDGAPNN